jgi:hypothetical protein
MHLSGDEIFGAWTFEHVQCSESCRSRTLQFSGESQIVSAHGQTVAIRHFAEGEGVLVGEIAIGRVMPSETILDGAFWTPEGPADSSTGWHRSGSAGHAIYLARRAGA